MRICNHCGSQAPDNNKFCSVCGAALPEVVQPAPQPAPSPAPQTAPAQQPYTYTQTYNQPSYSNTDNRTVSALAITGFVISLVSILCCGLTSIIGLIFSIAGMIAASKKDKKGMGFAIAGLIISTILTIFIVFSVVVSWAAIKVAWEEASKNGDYQEFLEVLQSELDEMEAQENGRSSSRRSSETEETETGLISGDWNDYEVSDDMSTITITYTDGIPDDFEFFDTDFDEICDVLEDEMVSVDVNGSTVNFDRETFRRLVSMEFISPEEYERMNLTSSQLRMTLSYLATLSFEMSSDNFVPDSAIYYEDSNSYEYYGIINRNNIGHCVIVFTDGTNEVYFEDAMCGDEICWAFDFSDPDTYRLGMSSDTLNDYPANGFQSVASWVNTTIQPLF